MDEQTIDAIIRQHTGLIHNSINEGREKLYIKKIGLKLGMNHHNYEMSKLLYKQDNYQKKLKTLQDVTIYFYKQYYKNMNEKS